MGNPAPSFEKGGLRGISDLPSNKQLLIAYSGGLDSHVLLHACAQFNKQQPFLDLKVVHIHHGLSSLADDWSNHCVQQAALFNLSCKVIKVDAKAKSGESPEAAARFARYQALYCEMDEDTVLVTAHQKDDQVETFLLNLLRGAGVRGLGAMPFVKKEEVLPNSLFSKGRITIHYRPLLDCSRQELEDYARHFKLKWIEDESNLDTGFDRNYLRHEVLPLLLKRWPGALDTISRAADHCFVADQLLNDLAAIDLVGTDPYIRPNCGTGQAKISELNASAKGGRIDQHQQLSISALKDLSHSRQKNLIRHWLIQHNYPLPCEARLEELINNVCNASIEANPCIKWSNVEARRYQNKLYVFSQLKPFKRVEEIVWSNWRESLTVPAYGQIVAMQTNEIGIARHWLDSGIISIKCRQGGERCKPYGRAHSQELKKVLQEYHVPPWERERLLLVYINQQLAAVIGLFYCDWVVAKESETAVIVTLKSNED